MNHADQDIGFPNSEANPTTSTHCASTRRRSDGLDSPVSSKRARLDQNLSQYGVTSIIGQSSSSFASTSLGISMQNSLQASPCTRDTDMDDLQVSTAQRSAVIRPEKSYRRDPTYYMDDGSCILLIEDTLFNVHRSILARDNSSFGTMFTLPQGNNEAEGRSDSNPIVLVGETAQEFRHFLWALYALPHELRVVTSPSADLNQLIAIARVANKYSFKSLETWALDAIQEYVNRKPSPILNAIPNPTSYMFFPHGIGNAATSNSLLSATNIESTAQLTRLIRLAQMCAHERLLNTMITLLKQLMGTSLQYAYLAMSLADELDLRALKGPAYLEVMHKAVLVNKIKVELPAKPRAQQRAQSVDGGAGSVQESTSGNQAGVVDDKDRLVINPSQQLRLLSGFYRLSRLWEGLRLNPPAFDHAPACGATWHQHGCTQSWLEFWKEKTRGDAVLAIGMADILGRLRQVQKEFERWGSATYMHHDCRMSARKSIQDLIKGVEDALPEYFSDGAS